MISMAPRKKTKKPTPEPVKKANERARDRGEVILMTVEITPELDAAIEKFRQDDKRTKKAVITIAIEKYLTEKGYWPPEPKPKE